MIGQAAIQQAVESHQGNLMLIVSDSAKEIEATYKSYSTAHSDNVRALEVNKRDAAKKREDKTFARTFEIRQKEFDDALNSAQTLFQHSEARIESEFETAMESTLARYKEQLAREVASFSSHISQ